MIRKPILLLLGTLTLSGGILGMSSAAMADPPWARGGERGFRHGGPPPWAPAHGYRRNRDFGYGGNRAARAYEGRRYGGYGYDRY